MGNSGKFQVFSFSRGFRGMKLCHLSVVDFERIVDERIGFLHLRFDFYPKLSKTFDSILGQKLP
jgi:hypothetical protein